MGVAGTESSHRCWGLVWGTKQPSMVWLWLFISHVRMWSKLDGFWSGWVGWGPTSTGLAGLVSLCWALVGPHGLVWARSGRLGSWVAYHPTWGGGIMGWGGVWFAWRAQGGVVVARGRTCGV